MKNIIYSVAAMALAFFSVSCQQENLEPAAGGTVTYTVQVPDAIATKAIGDDLSGVTKLIYEVYKQDEAGNLTEVLYEAQTPESINNEGKFTFNLEFIKNHNYTVLFWAYNPETTGYDTSDLRAVKLSQNLVANNEAMAVFAGSDQVVNCQSTSNGNVTLVRPVAQINVVTNDESLAVGTTPITLKQSSLKVKGLSNTYNVADKSVGSEDMDFTYAIADADDNIPSGTFTIGTEDYKYVAMNYVGFASELGDNVDLELTIKTSEGEVYHEISNIPVKPNYRTNIYGNLITASADYAVELKEDWSDPTGGNMEAITEGLIKNINGDYEVSKAAGLAYAINNLFVDANGVANTATFYVKPGIYDMAQQTINDVTVTSGTLKVYDTEAVVTRSATTGSVVIKGLKKALIQKVEDGATVFFSGITITDFNGADDAAALVQTNEGKVVLADCDIVNEQGEDTELVGGNAPVEVEKGEEAAGDLIYTAEQLAAAFADESVESIALGADITLENTLTFPEGREATLDLRGWELTVNEPATNYAINNHGTLTIKDSYATGEVNARGIYNGYVAEGDPITDAELTIISGTFNAMGTNGGAAVYNYGKAVINGGKFQSNGGYGLNSQAGAVMTVNSADVRGGIYNCGTLTVTNSKVYQHLSGKHAIYNWTGSVTIESGEFDSKSGNELIFADGENASVTINDGEFHKTAKSWLYAAAADKNITFVINGGTHYGYVNEPEMTVDTFRPYGDPIVVTGGSYNFDANKWCAKDYKAVKNDDTAMWDVDEKVYVAKIGEDGYESLQEAVEAVKDGETITFVADVEQVDGIILTDKNITVDLNGQKFTVSEGASTNNRNFKINGSSVVTIKNGTMVAAGEYSSGAYGTVRTEGTANVTLEDVKLYNYRGNGLNVKALSGTTVTISNTEIYSQYGGGVEAAGGIVELTNVKVEQKGMYTAPYNSMAISVNGGGTVTVKSGTYSTECLTAEEANNQGTSHGPWCAGVLNSGGTLIIKGGTFSNDNFGDNSLATYARGLLLADTGANIQIEGGIFNAVKAIVDVTNNLGDATRNPSVTLAGGDFSADPRVSGLYASNLISVADGCVVKETEDGRFTIGRPVAKVGNTDYGSIDEAIAAWTNNATLTLLSDVTLSDVVTLKSTEHHILDLGTYTMTAAKGKNAIEIENNARSSASYALDIKADATNPGGITATSKAVVKTTGKSGVKDRPIIRFYNGVYNASNVISHSGSNGTNCPQFQFHGGVYNATLSANRAMIQIYGGTFNGTFYISVDSSAYALIAGGKFKYLDNLYGSALNADKFTIGSAKGVFDRGVYVDDEGYIVVGGPVITEFGDKFKAKATNPSKAGSYLLYSSAATNGLYYTNAEAAIKKHGEANVELK